jgi:hypothetical protein
VGGADEVLPSFLVDFQIIGDVFAVRPITKSQSIWWMVKTKVFHEIFSSDANDQWFISLFATSVERQRAITT